MAETLFDEINGVASGIEEWQNLIWGSKPEFQHVGMRTPDRSFAGSLSRNVLDRVSTHRIEVEARNHGVRRDAEHIRHTRDPHYVLIFQLDGQSEFVQRGTHAILRPGDLTLAHSSTPYTWLFPEDFEVYMLILPQSLVDAPPGPLRRLAGTSIRSEGPFGQALTAFIDAIAHDQSALRGPHGRRAMRNLVEVVSTRLLTELDAQTPPREQAAFALFRQLTDYIAEHLGDPDLTPRTVASANFMSVRYAQAVFQNHGATMSSWVRERRLSRVREELGDPLLRDRPVGDVAAAWGFYDQSSFSRTFRLAFGESPSQWRARSTA